MQKFNGFPDGKVTLTQIPEIFFSDILPYISHVGELKITLYFFWRLARSEDKIRYLSLSDIMEDQQIKESFETIDVDLTEAIELAVARGTLLSAQLDDKQKQKPDQETYYFLNTSKGRAAIDAIHHQQWNPKNDPTLPYDIRPEPPSIYRVYEENIGPLTPMIADSLKDAEDTYPVQWIYDAIRIAVDRNKRSWSYAAAILDRWQREGRDARTEKLKNRADSEETRRRYIEGEFSDFVEH